MKPITDEWIDEWSPCPEALDWWDGKERDPIVILKKLMNEEKYDWANWFIVRVMTYKQYVSYAVFAPEQVLHVYEKEYDDNRPRKTIEAARRCIEEPNTENKNAARAACNAANAAYADASYADSVAKAAACAAWTAYAGDAAYAGWAADAAYWARGNGQKTILQYGIKLLQVT